MRVFTDFVMLSYATGMILTYNIYFKMQTKKLLCPILFEIDSDKYSSCMSSNGFWIVLVINILLIPAILVPTLSRLAYFEAFSLFAMIGAATPFFFGLIKMTMLSE